MAEAIRQQRFGAMRARCAHVTFAALCLVLLPLLFGCSGGPAAATTGSTGTPATPRSTTCASGADCALGPGLSHARLIVEPDDGISPFTGAIASATQSVQVELYLLTDTRIVQALEEAANRGVDVRVLLELHPLGENPTGPQKTFDSLAAAGVHMKAADPAYTLTHEKAMIVDGATLYVMTCNLTKSALGGSSAATNREYAVVDTDGDDVREAQAIFQADWDRTTTPQDTDPNLLVSPLNARTKLSALIASTQSSLLLDQEEMYDSGMEDALIAAAGRGVRVQVLLPQAQTDDPTATGGASQDVARLAQGGVQVRYTTTLYMHAKIVVADGARAFIGSENFSAQSLDSNRELGVLVADPAVLARLTTTFAMDWSTSKAA